MITHEEIINHIKSNSEHIKTISGTLSEMDLSGLDLTKFK